MLIVHTADWHLSAQRSKIDPETGLNARLMDFYRCGRFAVEDGIRRGAGLVVHCGDVFDGCRPTPTEVRLAKQAFAPAQLAGVPVVIVKGNHDDVRAPAERHALDHLRDMRGITVVEQPALLNVWEGPDGVVVEPPEMATPDGSDLALQLAVLPYPNKQLLLASEANRRLEPGQLNELVREKMMDCLRGLAARRIDGIPCLLLGHFSVDLAVAGGMNRLMMLGGEWTLNLHDLQALGFDGMLLGHIHKPQERPDEHDRWVAYCGSPEAVTFGEEGEEKHYLLWEATEGGLWFCVAVPTPYRRFVTLEFEEDAPWHPAMPPEVFAECKDAIVRVRVRQAADVDLRRLREQLEAAGVHEYQVETQRAETVRRRAVAVSSEMALDQALTAWLEQRPELKPMTEALLAEARNVERALQEEVDR